MGQGNDKSWHKFSLSPSHVAMIRALFHTNVFIPRQRQIRVKVRIHTMKQQAAIKALLDSGTTDSFISQMVIERFGIPTYKLSQTHIIRNVDGTPNSLGGVNEAATLKVNHSLNSKQCPWFEPKRNNPLLNSFNVSMILAWRVNIDVKPVLSKNAAIKSVLSLVGNHFLTANSFLVAPPF